MKVVENHVKSNIICQLSCEGRPFTYCLLHTGKGSGQGQYVCSAPPDFGESTYVIANGRGVVFIMSGEVYTFMQDFSSRVSSKPKLSHRPDPYQERVWIHRKRCRDNCFLVFLLQSGLVFQYSVSF